MSKSGFKNIKRFPFHSLRFKINMPTHGLVSFVDGGDVFCPSVMPLYDSCRKSSLTRLQTADKTKIIF